MSEGIRSIQHRWMGGSAAVPATTTPGRRSMQCWWMGGGGTSESTPPTVTADFSPYLLNTIGRLMS